MAQYSIPNAMSASNHPTFLLKGSGTVVAVNTEISRGEITVDVTEDGEADLKIQIGPVYSGTSLRDSATMYRMEDFNNSMNFANFATALNEKAGALYLDGVRDQLTAGMEVEFLGSFTYTENNIDAMFLMPAQFSVKGG